MIVTKSNPRRSGISPVRNPALAGLCRDHIMPGFMAAAAQHDCDLIWSEIGALNGICHDKHFIMDMAFIEEFTPATGHLKEDKRELVSKRLAEFKYIINSDMKSYMLPALTRQQFDALGRILQGREEEKTKVDFLAITRGMC